MTQPKRTILVPVYERGMSHNLQQWVGESHITGERSYASLREMEADLGHPYGNGVRFSGVIRLTPDGKWEFWSWDGDRLEEGLLSEVTS